jgi:hypothetical protein
VDNIFKILLSKFMLIVLQHIRHPNLLKDAHVDNLSTLLQTYQGKLLAAKGIDVNSEEGITEFLSRNKRNMNNDLLTKIESEHGTFMVLTKIRYLLFFQMPRSSVMPYGPVQFAATSGFMVQYKTVESTVLSEWHDMLCGMLHKGMFQSLCESVRTGKFPYPEGKNHLAQYVKRFR